MYRKSHSRKQYESKVSKCAAMRAAKARKRIERAESMVDCGGLVTDGCLGNHTIRLLAWPDDGQRVAIVVDGQHRQARTLRGVWRSIATMIGNTKGET